jgi:hypothetical protein
MLRSAAPFAPDEVQFGPSWDKKLISFGKQMHRDGTPGFFSKSDFEYIAEKCIEVGNMEETRAKQVRRKVILLWETFFSNDAKDDAVDQETFLNAVKQHHLHIKEACLQFFSFWFDCVDISGDGLIQVDEYAKMLSWIDIVDKDQVQEAFTCVDTNGDGVISHDEFVHAACNYFMINEESPPKTCMFGPVN